MTATINQCTDRLELLLDQALVDSQLVNDGYDYRTTPDRLRRAYMFYCWSTGNEETKTTGGTKPYYDYNIVIFAQHKKTETSLRQADRDLGDIENAVLDALLTSRPSEWLSVSRPYPSHRPRAAYEMPETRILEIPIRLNPR